MREVETKQWYSISITVGTDVSEAVEHAFNSLEALGTEINYFQKQDGSTVTVLGYFDSMPDEERVEDELHYALKTYGFTEDAILKIERAEIQDADWLAEWKRHWTPTVVGGFVIAPPWSEVDANDKIVIRIEPNMAFGTGTHETTQLCLRAIEQYYRPGDRLLDIGTGTGILAIVAAKINLKSEIFNVRTNFRSEISNLKSESESGISDLKSEPEPEISDLKSDLKSEISYLKSQISDRNSDPESEVSDLKSQISDLKSNPESEISNLKSQISSAGIVACDTDADAVTIAIENAGLNGVGSSIEFFVGSISSDTPSFDFTCANLTLDVIGPILPLLLDKTKHVLLLSGILAEQKEEIVNKLHDAGISHPEISQAGEWISVVVRQEW